jgi:hypothetical protein
LIRTGATISRPDKDAPAVGTEVAPHFDLAVIAIADLADPDALWLPKEERITMPHE